MPKFVGDEEGGFEEAGAVGEGDIVVVLPEGSELVELPEPPETKAAIDGPGNVYWIGGL